MNGASEEPDRKTWIIINDDNDDDDDVEFLKDADDEADEPAHVWRDRRTHWWRRNKLISQWWKTVPRYQ